MKILYVGYEKIDRKTGGGIVSATNLEVLKEIYKENLYEVNIKIEKSFIKNLKNYFLFSFKGQTKEIENKIYQIIKTQKIEKIFFDGSIFGNLYKKIKKINKDIEIVTFFHNIEKKYYLKRVKVEGILRIILLPNIFYNEKLSVKYSNKIIVLNERDKEDLEKIYKNFLSDKKIFIIPIMLKDRYKEKKLSYCDYDYLFIGSKFYANVHGISWFIENVLPNVTGKLLVIGKGMEILKQNYHNISNLKIVGAVENVDKYYYDDNIIISPIFHGSGMKTKTIEALMFNKYIVGTREAFIGIKNINFIGKCCQTKEDFIRVLNNLEKEDIKKIDSRKIYLDNFNYKILFNKYKEIFK